MTDSTGNGTRSRPSFLRLRPTDVPKQTRFFLGITEAPYYPGAVYILSTFYNRKEIATRIAILYTGNILATAFAGLIAAGIFKGMDDLAGISGWRWLFILQGAVTFVIAVVGFFVLPDTPLTTKWLTPEERQLAHNRIEMDTVENKGEASAWDGFKQATSDPMVWLFAVCCHFSLTTSARRSANQSQFMAHMHLAANGFKNFVSHCSELPYLSSEPLPPSPALSRPLLSPLSLALPPPRASC